MALSATTEELQRTMYFLKEQNTLLKLESYSYKLRIQCMQEEYKMIKKTSVNNQAKLEQEGEFISNRLISTIQKLQKENELLVQKFNQAENPFASEKMTEEKNLVHTLQKKIQMLQAEALAQQCNIDRCQREKIDLENILEQEQEAFVNRLWKQMDKLENENRNLESKLHIALTNPVPARIKFTEETRNNLTKDIQALHTEVANLRTQFVNVQQQHAEKIERSIIEGRKVREENLKLKWNLQLEIEKSEILRRNLTEFKTSSEIAEKPLFNQMVSGGCTRTETNLGPSELLSSSQMITSRRLNTSSEVASNRCSVCGAGTIRTNIDAALGTTINIADVSVDHELREAERNEELTTLVDLLSVETEVSSDSSIESEAIDGVNN